MPISHDTRWFGVNDAKIYKLETDPAGGPATYATGIDVPGIKTVGVTGEVNTNELRGDGKRLDFGAVIGGYSLTFEFAKLSLDVIAAVQGATITDSGVSPAGLSKLKIGSNDQLNYFKFEAQTFGVDIPGGDGHLVIHKAILSATPPVGMAEEDYQTFTVEGACVATIASDGDDLIDLVLNETAVDIAA